MNEPLKLVLAQLNPVVGDVAGNTERVLVEAARARDEHEADLVLFPELFLCGYPPEDLLFHSGMRHQIAAALERLRAELEDVTVLVGFPEYEGEAIYNAAIVLGNQRHPAAEPALIHALNDSEPLIRGAVAWALGRLATPAAIAALQSRFQVEDNADVQAELKSALPDAESR